MCAMMEVLKHFHFLNLQGKFPGYSFFRALEFQMDNTGLSASVSSINMPCFLLVAHDASIQGTGTGSNDDINISQLHAVSLSSLMGPWALLTRLKDQMASFMLMTRQWHHIKMVKRAGRAFDPGGISAAAPGSLAIPCRACPMPNINLPHGWENVPPAQA
jgi:hypothetical protein